MSSREEEAPGPLRKLVARQVDADQREDEDDEQQTCEPALHSAKDEAEKPPELMQTPQEGPFSQGVGRFLRGPFVLDSSNRSEY